MVKVLKIKIGTVFIDGAEYPVYQDAWEKTAKDGNTYYEARMPVFVNQIEKKEDSKPKVEA